MAERIDHDVKPTPIGPDAREELERLLQSLHEQGMLRFANDVVSAKSPVLKVLLDGLGKQATLNAIQNLSILGMALSRIPPEEFYKLVFGMKDALAALSRSPTASGKEEAPGVTGVYRMLNDDELWASLRPALDAVQAFSRRMAEPADKPVTQFTGKQTEM
ncbi:DUF1641 domain-containing protein [Bordetella sp. 02P26C-1]|uniref:DUF1641 domain-containing protein n=1 Tax=Bordetella sp. 02P26C-1 TaxID=2683195 RepID=UPI0013540293|nr:DUF1641 domain-containing protein [Bordetella sp. 02P26C-1]MVW78279.1 DUF1641 domain-containing protein [Bordetella sp. 02P26C-1]